MSNTSDFRSDITLGQKLNIRFNREIVGDASGYTPYPLNKGDYYIPAGAATASSELSTSYVASYVLTETTNTFWQTASCSSAWLQIDLGIATWTCGFGWHPGGTSYFAKTYNVLGSNDGATWSIIYSGSQSSSSGLYSNVATWAPVMYRYYKWDFLTLNSRYIALYYIKLQKCVGNEGAFTVSGKEYKYIGGPLLDKNYSIDSFDFHPAIRVWEQNCILGFGGDLTLTNSSCTQTTGKKLSTSVTTNAGDCVIATVAHRSTFTVPNGWTKLYESDEIGSKQKLVFMYKYAQDAGTTSFTGVQTASAQMYINLISVSNVDSIEYVPTYLFTTGPTTRTTTFNIPNKVAGECLVWGATANLWVGASPYPNWVLSPNDITILSVSGATLQQRLANFLDLSGTGSINHSVAVSLATTAVIAALRLTTKPTASTLETDVINLPAGNYRVSCEGNTSQGTVTIEACTGSTKSDWFVAPNGYVTVDTNLWLRVSWVSSDKTFSIKNICIEEADIDSNRLLLTFKTLGRFNNVEGDITVSYDATKSSLAGASGPVLSFTKSFTPTGLFKKPNPSEFEKITAVPSVTGPTITMVTYKKGYDSEKITGVPSCTLVATYVGTVNP